ncbi:Aluminum-activated malate transporter [Macleaya cordata]|uniref:Aluminum-activated malate transporter n=1 Tax=Macleaya cordata TaxID=56857 RepID=A0A200Q4T8_MACCD|nr:Aluminum-activated malate transporter [Macleaya cordata]
MAAVVDSSTVISIPNEVEKTSMREKKSTQSFISSLLLTLKKKLSYDHKKLIHSLKVGVALVLVSLLYLIDPLYEQVGENAMWAIMTVVVLFEYSAGATLGKGLNRGMGTILGGGLGCLAAILAQKLDWVGSSIVIGTTIFIFGAIATYSRLIPNFKKKHDYGAMIFILTFNLVAVSGLQGEKVLLLARERFATIVIGFAICVFTSLLVFPVWSSDELHSSIASKFDNLAQSIEGCLEEYFEPIDEKGNEVTTNSDGYISVLNSKAKDDILRNFARWEPWHGKFGFYHPWDKYLQIGELLRELAATTLSLKGCLRSPRQPSSVPLRLSIKEPCETAATLLACSLRELGDSITQMKKCQAGELMIAKLQSTSFKLNVSVSASKLDTVENGDGLAMSSFVFLLMEMIDKVEVLAKEVEELGVVAGFHSQ